MSLTEANQDLRRNLRSVASNLKWSAVELTRIAARLRTGGNEPDAQALLRMCTLFGAGEDRLLEYAEEISQGRINRDGALCAISDTGISSRY